MRAIVENIVVGRLLFQIERVTSLPRKAMDVLPLSQSYVLDFVSAFAFGLSLGNNLLTDKAALQHYIDLYNDSFPGGAAGFWLKGHPRITRLLCSLGVPMIPKTYFRARCELEAWTMEKVHAAETLLHLCRDKETLAAGSCLYFMTQSGQVWRTHLVSMVVEASPRAVLSI
jgi:hypothetical protein